MRKQKIFIRLSSLAGTLVLVAGIAVQVLVPTAHAATQITNRSLTLEDQTQAGVTTGGSAPGDGTTAHEVKHLFTFTLNDTNASDTVGSLTFQYCTTAAPVSGGIGCVAPTGIDVSHASLTADTGVAGFTTLTTSSVCDTGCTATNTITIGRASSTQIVSVVASTKEFSNIINPSTANQTFFVRIKSWSGTAGTGSNWEAGTVAASTANPIVIQGTMPESLVFCTGATISTTAGVPDCTTATAGNIFFNQLFSPTSTSYATSQMAASTNAGQGYAITVGGPTLTSGSNTISAMTATDTSKFGISQFGMDLVKNDGTAYANAPNIPNSANIAPASNGTNYNAYARAGFNTAGSFTFNASALNNVANSASATSGTTPVGTDAQIYTASYIVNVPGSQPAGTYTSTLTYICTPTF